MKKLLALLAVTAALTAQASAQTVTSGAKPQMTQRQHIMVRPDFNQPLGPIQGEIGLATDPDPNVRLDLHRNYDHYANGTS